MSLPYIIPVTVEYPSGTALTNIQAILRNQSTDELLTESTDGNGRVVFDCSNFSSGYTVGDVVEYTVSYTAYEGSGSHTIIVGGGAAEATLVLSAYPSVPILRYFVPKDLYTYFNLEPFASDSTTGIKSRRLSLIGEGVEADIDSECNTRFDSANAVTTEYHDVEDTPTKMWWLRKTPVQSITLVEINTAAEESTATWITLTVDTDYEHDSETGRLTLLTTTNWPEPGHKQLRVTYTYGYSSVPAEIKQLAILMAGYRLKGTDLIRQYVQGLRTGETTDERFINYQNRILNKYRQDTIRNT